MIYLIKRYDFDELENRSSEALITTTLGYTNTLEEAKKYVEMQEKIKTVYRVYTGEFYPMYKIESVNLISVSEVEGKPNEISYQERRQNNN